MCTEQCIEWHTRTHTQPPLPMAPPCQWPPHPEGRIMVPPFNGPPFRERRILVPHRVLC